MSQHFRDPHWLRSSSPHSADSTDSPTLQAVGLTPPESGESEVHGLIGTGRQLALSTVLWVVGSVQTKAPDGGILTAKAGGQGDSPETALGRVFA